MGTIELKHEFHGLIDRIKDKTILEKFFYLMESAEKSASGSLLDKLSDKEKSELFSSDDESAIKGNLISNEAMKKKHNKWL
ncbi:MAG TPA: hypothetical protein VEA37_00975 [Flavobacterium sp.]|nr:hypothetical protein [Flavobacterium sp.]